MTRSGIIRYPRQLGESLRQPGVLATHALSRTHAEELLGRAAMADLAALWIGHATVLMRLGRRWILTDPVFSQRVGVRVGPYTFGLGRLTAPALTPELLPPIDLVIVSHAHFDHLDAPTLRALASGGTTVVTAPRTRRLVPAGFKSVCELGWDEELDVGGVRVRAMQPSHWGARTAVDRRRGYNSYVLTDGARRVLFAGDTADTRAFAGAGPLDLAIFGIGGYEPWVHAHATPEQVWRMSEEAGAAHLLPVHHSTFPQSDEPPEEPMQRLLKAAGSASSRIVAAAPGDLWLLGSEPQSAQPN